MKQHEIEILQRAIAAFGVDRQLKMVIEECAETTLAICKRWRAMDDHYGASVESATVDLRKECADLLIMANQLALMMGGMDQIQPLIDFKLGRLLPRIEESESAHSEAVLESLTGQAL